MSHDWKTLRLTIQAALLPLSGWAATYSGPVIDMHAHVRTAVSDVLMPGHPIGTEDLLRLDAEAHVSTSALVVIAPRNEVDRTEAQNDAVMALARESHGHFYPVVSVHPLDGAAALQELERTAARGARVLKLHPNTQNFDVADPAVATVVDKAGELGMVILFDSYKPWDTNELGKFMLLSMEHPRTRFILAHMGLSHFRDAATFATLREFGMGDNVWFDVSAIATMYARSPVAPELVWTLRTIGVDRILFGSDWPVDTPAKAVQAVGELGLSPAELQKIFHDNAAALLSLD
jgi:hypothetical protein